MGNRFYRVISFNHQVTRIKIKKTYSYAKSKKAPLTTTQCKKKNTL